MKMIIQYDEVSDHEFEIPEFRISNYSSEEKMFEVERFNIFEAIYNAVVLGVNHKYPQVPCFSVEEAEAVISIEKSDYLEKIEECTTFYLEQEEYMKCSILKSIKEKLLLDIQELNI